MTFQHVPYPQKKDITQTMRDKFERLYQSSVGDVRKKPDGEYLSLRTEADWVFYQRAWADALETQASPGEITLNDYAEGQWWVQELDKLKDVGATIKVTADMSRAVAVVHSLLSRIADQPKVVEPDPNDLGEFDKGDTIVCVDSKGAGFVTQGKEYQSMSGTQGAIVVIRNDIGEVAEYHPKRFIKKKD